MISSRDKKAMWVNKHIIKSHKKFYKHIVSDGETYEVEIHRAQYWFDNKPITSETTHQLKKTWHLSYWIKYDSGSRIQLWTSQYPMFEMCVGNKKFALNFGKSALELIISSKQKAGIL